MLRFRRDRVATTPSASTGIGHRRRGPARPPRNALRRFTPVRHHDTPMASSRPALTEAPAAHNKAALGTARSIPGRALASSMLDSPCQGSRTGLTPPISTPVPSTPGGSPSGSPPAPPRTETVAETGTTSLVEGMTLSFVHARGRDAGCPTPPAQIPASGTTALGSSLGYERRSERQARDGRS
jgi:hypothetical protein